MPVIKKERRPATDPGALAIESGVPLPRKAPGGSRSPWEPVLRKMQPGDSVFVPDVDASSLAYVRKVANRLGMSVTARNAEGGARLFLVSNTSSSGKPADGLG